MRKNPSRLKIARVTKGLTQRELATKVGANMMQISRWEKRAYVPTPSMQAKLAKALGTAVGELFGG